MIGVSAAAGVSTVNGTLVLFAWFGSVQAKPLTAFSVHVASPPVKVVLAAALGDTVIP